VFSDLLARPAIAEKLGADRFLQALESLAVGTNLHKASDFGDSLKFFARGFGSLLELPLAQTLPRDLKVKALQIVAETGQSTLLACQHSSVGWIEVLTWRELMRLLQLAVQNGHYEEFSVMCVHCPAADELSPGEVLQLALQLMHAWIEEGDLGNKKASLPPDVTPHQVYMWAWDGLSGLPGLGGLSEQQCNQLADVGMQKGRHHGAGCP
jgi:hypothetical protein